MIKHYDLFAGIGGFSLAADTIFGEVEHTFVEYDPFCQSILKKHWPDAEINGDIRQFVADTTSKRLEGSAGEELQRRDTRSTRNSDELTIVTGGFPCQPFSAAGRRKGTADDRYLWPEMFEVIKLTKPDWIIAENVRGLVTWNDGMVLEQVCADLEGEGYEVQPVIIPAVAVNAPHRRDRVWIIANRAGVGRDNGRHNRQGRQILPDQNGASKKGDQAWRRRNSRTSEANEANTTNTRRETTPNTRSQRRQARSGENLRPESQESERSDNQYPDWQRNWQEVAFATCHDGVDDGLPRRMDGVTISAARHRKERLKAMGNSIVPQVAMEIFKSMRIANDSSQH